MSETSLADFARELGEYFSLVDRFHLSDSVRENFKRGRRDCNHLKIHSVGLDRIFQKTSLSRGPFGRIEPLLPPLRHPSLCTDRTQLMNLEYLVHDFQHMCTDLTATSRVMLFDLGASLSFHSDADEPPVVG